MTGRRARPRSSASCARSRPRPRPRSVFACCWRIADGVSSIDARARARLCAGGRELAASLADAHARAPSRSYLQGRCADLLLDHATALDALRRGARRFREGARRRRAVAKTLRAISFVHDALGDSSRALDYQFRALAIDQRTGNDSSRAATLRMIGVVYSRTGDAASGLDFYRRSLALCTQPSDAIERGKTLNNIGINLKNLGQLAEAAGGAGRRVQDLRRRWACRCSSAPPSTTSALVQERKGDRAIAETHAARGARAVGGDRLSLRRRACEPRAWARCASAHARYDEARKWLAAALDVCERHNLKPTQFEVHEVLADYYEKTRRPRSAPRTITASSTRSSVKCSRRRRATSCARCRSSSRSRPPGAKPSSSASGRRSLTRANADLDALNISLTEANLQKTMLLDQLERQTYEDALTGLANRRRLDQRLNDEFALALRARPPARRRDGRPRPLQGGQRPVLARGRRRRAAGHGEDPGRAGAAHRPRGALRRRGVRDRAGGDGRAGGAARVREAAPGDRATQLERDPPLAFAHDIDRRDAPTRRLPTHERMLAAADRNLYTAKAAGRNRVVG